MAETRVGIIGVGVVGEQHLLALRDHAEIRVVGIADQSDELRSARAREFDMPAYASPTELLEMSRPDYVTVCTPHYSHTDIAVEAMRRGVHVLVEKPFAVSASRVDECLAVMRETGMKLGVGFLRRLHPPYRQLFDLIQSGFVGEAIRVTLVRTQWFRSMAYYRSNPWRATWAGEGGGILVNQAPHDLDLIAWTLGLPSEVLVELNTIGHEIEVEDDVCALMKWAGGATGTLHVSTREAPGRDFFEIAGTKGTLLLEGDCLKATRLSVESREFSETTMTKMDPPPIDHAFTFCKAEDKDLYRFEQENFAAAIRGEGALMCSGEEGLKEVELANALLVSGLKQEWVSVPAKRVEFDHLLSELVRIRSIPQVKASLKNQTQPSLR